MVKKFSYAASACSFALLALLGTACAEEGSDFEQKTNTVQCSPEDEWAPETATTCTPAAGNELCHEFFANDNFRNRVNYVNEFDPSKNWTFQTPCVLSANCPRQVMVVDRADGCGKAVLISVHNGYMEIHPKTGELISHVQVPDALGVTGAVRLPDGNTAIGVLNKELRVVNAEGVQISTCQLPGDGDLRVLWREDDDTFWFGRMLELYGISRTCQQVWKAQLPAGSKAYRVRPVGDFVYATSGYTQLVYKYDRSTSQIVGSVGGKDNHPDLALDFFSGFYRIPDGTKCASASGEVDCGGNIVAANWLGHVEAPAADTPHLVELKPDNTVAWKWGNQELARQITNVWIVR